MNISFDPINILLRAFKILLDADDTNDNEKQLKRKAVSVVMKAVMATKAYQYDQQELQLRSREREIVLSNLWLEAAHAIHEYDRRLFSIFQIKSHGWARPDKWTVLVKRVSTVDLDIIIEQCNHLMETN